ncbi:MAG: hypothetical protein ACI857_003237 [Arenicella sp.]|jgi:hypothetical protein
MFAVIYSFKIKPNCEAEFIKAWEDLTLLIYEFENSIGSRIHRKSEFEFIAYAQWPDEATFKDSGSNMPESAQPIRKIMRDCCEEITTLHELEMVSDLLQTTVFED